MPNNLNPGETKNIYLPVKGTSLQTGLDIDPTGSALQIGFVNAATADAVGGPAPITWYTGFWITGPTGIHYAGIKLGPLGTYAIPAGVWIPWVNYSVAGELIIQPAGSSPAGWLGDTLTVAA